MMMRGGQSQSNDHKLLRESGKTRKTCQELAKTVLCVYEYDSSGSAARKDTGGKAVVTQRP